MSLIWTKGSPRRARTAGLLGGCGALVLAAGGVAGLIAGCGESSPACTAEECGAGGSGGGEPECAAPAAECAGDVPRVCDEAGVWQPQPACGLQGKVCADGVCVGPSCFGAVASCGPGGDEDCCASLEVPGGSFFRSSTLSQPPTLSNPASVSAFRLDRFEVTVGRFRRFVEAYPASKPPPGAGAHPLIGGTGWDPAWDAELPADAAGWNEQLACNEEMSMWTPVPGAGESMPMNCLSWYAAFAFCAWDGGRLPTEAEWLYAAVGGEEQRYYPWTTSLSEIDPSRAVYGCEGDGVKGCSPADIPRVGSRSPAGDGRWGQADMAGSLLEWQIDWYSKDLPNPCVDCADLDDGLSRMRHGGHYFYGASLLVSYIQYSNLPAEVSSTNGVRCARSIPPGEE